MFKPQYLKLSQIKKNRWRLEEDLTFTSNCLTKAEQCLLEEVGASIKISEKDFTIVIPEKTASDLASVPRFLWWFLSPWGIGKAAILHDHTHQACRQYQTSKQYKKEKYLKARALSNKLFLLSMKTLKYKPRAYKIYLAYVTVCMTTKLRDTLGIK